MNQTLYTLLSLDYLVLTLLSYSSIENFDLDRFASPIRTYHPLWSELFAFESILVYLIIAGAVLAQWAERETPVEEEWRFPGRFAVLFAVMAVPVKLMTHNLIVYDTSFFAFVLFFSLILLVCCARFLLFSSPTVPKHLIMMAVFIAASFMVYEPWNSPSLKMKNAILAGNSARFQRLAASYPQHLRMNSGLLDTACKKPDFDIIKRIVDSGNTSIDGDYMNQNIFNPQYINILEYMHTHGVKLARTEVLRRAIDYAAREPEIKKPNSDAYSIDKNYPVLELLIKLLNQAPEEDRKQKTGWSSGYSNLLSTAAASGNTDLMNFMLKHGFVIDEEVIKSLILNKHFDKPEIQALLAKAETVTTRPAEPSSNTAAASHPADITAQASVTDSTDVSINDRNSYATLQATTTIATEPVSAASGAAETTHTATRPDMTLPATAAEAISRPAGGLALLQPASDGLDLIIPYGADAKGMRRDGENVFHFIARYWRSSKAERTFYKCDYARLFSIAMERKIDLNQKSRLGQTPFWIALQGNNFRSCIRLLEAGADIGGTDGDGLTMQEYCRKNNRKILLGLLMGVNNDR